MTGSKTPYYISNLLYIFCCIYRCLTRSEVTILIILDVWQFPHISGRFCITTVIFGKFPLQLNIAGISEPARILPPVDPARTKYMVI